MPGSEESDDGRIDHRLAGVRKSFVDHKRYSQAERPEKLQRRQVRFNVAPGCTSPISGGKYFLAQSITAKRKATTGGLSGSYSCRAARITDSICSR